MNFTVCKSAHLGVSLIQRVNNERIEFQAKICALTRPDINFFLFLKFLVDQDQSTIQVDILLISPRKSVFFYSLENISSSRKEKKECCHLYLEEKLFI